MMAVGREVPCLRNCGSDRAGVHGISPPRAVSGASVERLAGGAADVTGADTGLAEDLGGAHDHGRPDPLTMQRRGDTDTANGPRGRASIGASTVSAPGPSNSRVPAIDPVRVRASKTCSGRA